MDRDKQIEEMAKAIEQARIKATDTTNSMNYGFGGWYAKELYNAGYRKASEVAREMFADFQSILFSIMYFGNDGKYHLRKINADKVTLIFEKYFELKKKYTEGGK